MLTAGLRQCLCVLCLAALWAPCARAAEGPAKLKADKKAKKEKKDKKEKLERGVGKLYIRADLRDFDYPRGIALLVGNVRFVPPGSEQLIAADAAVVWLNRKEAYLEGNIRIYKTLGKPAAPGEFDVPRPNLADRTGLAPNESLEKAGDVDHLIGKRAKPAILIDTRVRVSEAERVYVNWADGTAYLVKPTMRFAAAGRVANWVVTAPSIEGIATYEIPIVDKDGNPTGKVERRRHYVMNNATFTACIFKRPHTRITSTSVDAVEGDRMLMKNVLFYFGDIPVLYLPAAYKEDEYNWPYLKVAVGSSSRMGTFASVQFGFELMKGFEVRPRVDVMSERGVGYGLEIEYELGHDKDIRGALNAFWLPDDDGTDELADTSRKGSPWPGTWRPVAMGRPLPNDLPLGVTNRYRVSFTHQQEMKLSRGYGLELDVEVHKFSDAGVYREFFEDESKTAKEPETRVHLKLQRGNWAAFIHVKKQINNFLTQTEYEPQIGFNWIAQPIGGGFLFTTDTELARVTTRYGDTRATAGMTDVAIMRRWIRWNEYRQPPPLTLRQNDTDKLTSWRFDTVNIISRPFEWGIFDIEPHVGWRGTWYQHGIDGTRGGYGVAVAPIPPAAPVPAGLAVRRTRTGDTYRSQILAGTRVATQFHRTYDVSDRPFLRRLFQNGQRHIITPEIRYTYESRPTETSRHLPENDEVTEQDGLHVINFALRNRWQTKRARVERDPRAPLGGEWHRRKLAVEKARASDPVDVVDFDIDIDLFTNPRRDNAHLRGRTNRRWSNLRTDLTVRATDKTSLFLDTEFAVNGAGHSGAGGLEVIGVGVSHAPRPGLAFSLSHEYHFHDASLLKLAADWELSPKWQLRFDVQQDISGRGNWDRTVEVARRFHEWQVILGYEFDKGDDSSLVSVHISPTRTELYRPSWRFQPRSVAAFQLAESAR